MHPKTESAWIIQKNSGNFLIALGLKDWFHTQGCGTRTKFGSKSWEVTSEYMFLDLFS